METIVFQFQHRAIGLPEGERKLLTELSQVRHRSDIDVHVKKVEKKGLRIIKEFPLSDVDTQKN